MICYSQHFRNPSAAKSRIQHRKAEMKAKFGLFFGIIIAMTAVGCVGPRTGSVGHRYVPPVLTTNISGTVISQQVGNQPQVVYAQTNFTVVSTPPVEERTWRERVLGQRPPGATSPTPLPQSGGYGGYWQHCAAGSTARELPSSSRKGGVSAPLEWSIDACSKSAMGVNALQLRWRDSELPPPHRLRRE